VTVGFAGAGVGAAVMIRGSRSSSARSATRVDISDLRLYRVGLLREVQVSDQDVQTEACDAL
jgi:microcompartment protein CcmK/EutM